MDQLITNIAAKTGASATVVRKALAIIISFIGRESPPGQAAVMLDKLPGARELASESTGRGSGIMGVFGDLTATGLGVNAVQQVARMFVDDARQKVGDKDVDAVIRSIPGLSQFI